MWQSGGKQAPDTVPQWRELLKTLKLAGVFSPDPGCGGLSEQPHRGNNPGAPFLWHRTVPLRRRGEDGLFCVFGLVFKTSIVPAPGDAAQINTALALALPLLLSDTVAEYRQRCAAAVDEHGRSSLWDGTHGFSICPPVCRREERPWSAATLEDKAHDHSVNRPAQFPVIAILDVAAT